MTACEQRNGTSVSLCQCDLRYFEDRVSAQVFVQDSGENGAAGVPPPQLADVINVCGNS